MECRMSYPERVFVIFLLKDHFEFVNRRESAVIDCNEMILGFAHGCGLSQKAACVVQTRREVRSRIHSTDERAPFRRQDWIKLVGYCRLYSPMFPAK